MIYNTGLLNEWLDYGTHQKAKRVHRLCIKNKKLDIANNIKFKYNLKEELDDLAMAVGMALIYRKQQQNGK